MRTSSSSTWTADSGARRASALRPQPAPPKLACSEGPGPGPGAAGAPRQSCGLSPGGNTPRELREAAALLLHPPVVSVILPLTQRTCWLLEAPPEHPSGASPKTPSLTPAVSRRRPVAPVPLLPVSQTLGQGRGLSPSPHRPRDQALERDVAYQDSILCLQTVANPGHAGSCPHPSPWKCCRAPCPFVDATAPSASQGAQVPVAGSRPVAPGEGWTSGRKDSEAPAALQVLQL